MIYIIQDAWASECEQMKSPSRNARTSWRGSVSHAPELTEAAEAGRGNETKGM